MSEEGMIILVEFLQDHENDIANRINDFGDLLPVFLEIFHREPEE